MAASTQTKTQQQVERVEQEAVKLLQETKPNKIAEISLRRWLYIAKVLPSQNEDHVNICTYISNGQHHGFGIKVLDIIRIVRNGCLEFEHDEDKRRKFRMMLWHGTKTEYVARILENGFQKPQAKGQMFGTGIYFADRASKSAQYCPPTDKPFSPATGSVGYLFLCDVLLGDMYNSRNPRNDATKPPTYTDSTGEVRNCDSVRCTGKYIPNRKEQQLIKRCVWPLGETVKNEQFDSYTVLFNEFIVYDPDNVKPKFLVKVKFEDKPC